METDRLPGPEIPAGPRMTTTRWTPEDYRRNAWAEQDPELLGSQDLIRYGEQLIRREHRVTDDDALFWLEVADELNHLAGIPDRTGRQDWAEFSRARDIALGYMRRSQASAELRAELLRFFAPAPGQPATSPEGTRGCEPDGLRPAQQVALAALLALAEQRFGWLSPRQIGRQAREQVTAPTLAALVRLGLAEKGHGDRRTVYRITEAGVARARDLAGPQ